MKKNHFALAMAFVLTLALTGCSAGREGNTLEPSHSVTGERDGAHVTDGGNDAFQGGGAGGTNDRDNDGRPDTGVDDIGRDADDAVRDAGDAIGDAVDDIGRNMR